MGVNNFEIQLLERVIEKYKPESVIELGSQTNYTTPETAKPPFMSEWFLGRNIKYCCIDLAGDNNAIVADLSNSISLYEDVVDIGNIILTRQRTFPLLTDFGSSEHVVQMNEYETVSFHEGHINSIYPKGEIKSIEEGYYNCWVNKHSLLKLGGIMVNVNPLTGHWPLHGYSYLGANFYDEIVKISGYEIIEQGINCATGNCETGQNLYSILRKVSDVFPDFNSFSKLPIYKS